MYGVVEASDFGVLLRSEAAAAASRPPLVLPSPQVCVHVCVCMCVHVCVCVCVCVMMATPTTIPQTFGGTRCSPARWALFNSPHLLPVTRLTYKGLRN